MTKKNKISLGMTRLAIIGLSSGMQPQYSNDKKIVLVFNGEIFNYKELGSFYILTRIIHLIVNLLLIYIKNLEFLLYLN